MTLGAPAALWGLLILPAVLLLYLLRARRQEVPVSSVLLWQRAARDLRARRPLRRLEHSLLLALQLLILTLGVLALARPLRPVPAAGPLVVVVDTSASMQATDVAPSRFERARRLAREEIRRAAGPVALIEAGPQAALREGPGAPARALRALDALRPTDGAAAMDQAVAAALARLPGGESGRVVVFTDRAGPSVPGVDYRIVGTSDRNVGIAGIAADRLPSGTAAVVRVINAGRVPARVPLEVSVEGRPVLRQDVSVPAGGSSAVALRGLGTGVLTARLDAEDDLPVDDAAVAVLPPRVRVAVAGEEDRALLEALAASGAEVVPATAQELARADVVVINRLPLSDLPPGRYLLVGTVAPPLPVAVEGEAAQLEVVRWSAAHPVMRFVDFQDVTVSRALALRPAGGEVLAEGQWPLIWAYEGRGIRAVVLAAALDQTDVPLHAAFPIFVRNALAWLGDMPAAVRVGEPFTVPAAAATVTVTGPGGGTQVLPARGGAVSLVVERAGLYRLRDGDSVRLIAALPPPEESDIAPVFPPPSGGAGRPTAPAASRAVDVSPGVLAAAVVLAVIEWAVYLRTQPRRAPAGPVPRLRHVGVRR
ncbi:MAG: VWA domain-containing protein [Armatimonadota bacterium]|nr:VWA domain-containing protein [Armatimonadota bacterium]MDR7611241.1 VWA domain-containing protein [Armatimonadota bacterium]